ncbi:hypothetical protein [Deefgea piscis]|uniref:hypothetical protein n=1 Tax=Deefgea piscis TaxID=2739061 RepID=UPI001C7FAC3F|nr:hypothetical protein [Deefgea piscis]QZA80103.1 hypothetical protein K4H25_11190 [Deefgea piscis]
MDNEEYSQVGFVKYSGSRHPSGVIDAGSAGKALVGLDEVIRFFNSRQSPAFHKIEYDVPIKTEAGSWVAILMAGGAAIGGAFALGYAKKSR